jgi:uncharacterized protein DUF4386
MRKTAIAVGALFWISNLATIIGSVISGAIPSAPDALTNLSPREAQVVVGTLITHINDAAIIYYAVVLFTVLKRFGESLALGYVAFKTVEAILLLVGATAFLSVIPLSHSYLASAVSIACGATIHIGLRPGRAGDAGGGPLPFNGWAVAAGGRRTNRVGRDRWDIRLQC